MRIIFMGTPDFAVPSLDILVQNDYDVVAVVTAPDKPGGRQGIQQSAVKKYAESQGLLVLQPERLKNPEFLDALRALKADLQVVVAFRMLPEAVWNMPPMGTMNLHGSLLPKYRGAAPINWVIIRGETETGVTTFLLQHEIDTGDLLFQTPIPIEADDTAGELHDRMMQVGADLVLKSVQALEKGIAQPIPQADTAATHAPKIFAETCAINFRQPAQQVHDFVRGLSPYPGAWTHWNGKMVKIIRTCLTDLPSDVPLEVGEWQAYGKHQVLIGTLDGPIAVLALQVEGKRRMNAVDFLNGHQVGN